MRLDKSLKPRRARRARKSAVRKPLKPLLVRNFLRLRRAVGATLLARFGSVPRYTYKFSQTSSPRSCKRSGFIGASPGDISPGNRPPFWEDHQEKSPGSFPILGKSPGDHHLVTVMHHQVTESITNASPVDEGHHQCITRGCRTSLCALIQQTRCLEYKN